MKYELTITLKPVHYKFTAEQQFIMTKDHIWAILLPYEATAIAELTHEHNIHYHCMVEIDDEPEARDRLLNRMRIYNKWFGRKSLTQVSYEESYKNYIGKDTETTRKVINRDPVIRDFFGVCKMKMSEESQYLDSNQKDGPESDKRKKQRDSFVV